MMFWRLRWIRLGVHSGTARQTKRTTPPARGSAPKNDHYPVVGDHLASAEVEMFVVKNGDVHDVRFADLVQHVGNDFIEPILADLDAITVANAFDLKRFRAIRPRSYFQ